MSSNNLPPPPLFVCFALQMKIFAAVFLVAVFGLATGQAWSYYDDELEDVRKYNRYCDDTYGNQSNLITAIHFFSLENAETAYPSLPITTESVGCLLINHKDHILKCLANSKEDREDILLDLVQYKELGAQTAAQGNKLVSDRCNEVLFLAHDSIHFYFQLIERECLKTHNSFCRISLMSFLYNVVDREPFHAESEDFEAIKTGLMNKRTIHRIIGRKTDL